MQEWFNTTMQNLQAGDVGTGVMVLVALLVLFFVVKILMNTVKAIFIVLAVVVAIAIFMPEAGVLEKAKDLGENAAGYVKDNVNADSLNALKDKAAELAK